MQWPIACRTGRWRAASSVSLATSKLTRADRKPCSVSLASAPSDNTRMASIASARDRLASSRMSPALDIVRPRSATLIEDLMFSRAFSTRRNAAIAWTSGSVGISLILTGTTDAKMLVWKAGVP